MFLVQSHIGREEGRTTTVANPALKTIGTLLSQNIYDTSSRNEKEEYSSDNPVHDDVDDAIA